MQVNETCVFLRWENPVCNCKMGVRTAQAVTTVIRPDINNLLHSGIKFIPGSGRLDPQNTTEYPDLRWFPVEKFYLLYLGFSSAQDSHPFPCVQPKAERIYPHVTKKHPPGFPGKQFSPNSTSTNNIILFF